MEWSELTPDGLKKWGGAVSAVLALGWAGYERLTDDPILVAKAEVAEVQTRHLNLHYREEPLHSRMIDTPTGSILMEYFPDDCYGITLERGNVVTNQFMVSPPISSGLAPFVVPAQGPGRCLRHPEQHSDPFTFRMTQRGANGWVRGILTFDPARNGTFTGCAYYQDRHPPSGSHQWGPAVRCVH